MRSLYLRSKDLSQLKCEQLYLAQHLLVPCSLLSKKSSSHRDFVFARVGSALMTFPMLNLIKKLCQHFYFLWFLFCFLIHFFVCLFCFVKQDLSVQLSLAWNSGFSLPVGPGVVTVSYGTQLLV